MLSWKRGCLAISYFWHTVWKELTCTVCADVSRTRSARRWSSRVTRRSLCRSWSSSGLTSSSVRLVATPSFTRAWCTSSSSSTHFSTLLPLSLVVSDRTICVNFTKFWDVIAPKERMPCAILTKYYYYYRTQWTSFPLSKLREVLFLALSLIFLFMCEISREPLNGFDAKLTRKTCLVPRSH